MQTPGPAPAPVGTERGAGRAPDPPASGHRLQAGRLPIIPQCWQTPPRRTPLDICPAPLLSPVAPQTVERSCPQATWAEWKLKFRRTKQDRIQASCSVLFFLFHVSHRLLGEPTARGGVRSDEEPRPTTTRPFSERRRERVERGPHVSPHDPAVPKSETDPSARARSHWKAQVLARPARTPSKPLQSRAPGGRPPGRLAAAPCPPGFQDQPEGR